MTQEDYISFEIAKLLKKKGFDVNCYAHYSSDGQKVHYNFVTPSDGIPRPTLQMAMKWLREEHHCHICVQAFITTDGLQGYCPFYIKVGSVPMWQNSLGEDYAAALTYEEACEAAIKYCLENLI